MPIRIAVSPRAWMMKGDATWKALSAAAPLIRVRRLNFGLKGCVVMISPSEVRFLVHIYRHCEERQRRSNPIFLFSSGLLRFARNDGLEFGFAWCAEAPGVRIVGVRSGRPLDLAAGGLDRSGGFLARHRIFHREHLVRIALRWMRLADEHGAHQLVVAGAVFRRSRLQRDFRRQLEASKRACQFWGVAC